MSKGIRGLCAAVLVGLASAATAADLTVWWNKSYYPEEDQQFDKIVKEFQAKTGKKVEYVMFTNEDVPRKVLAALTAGEPPDLSYAFLFDVQHTARWAFEDVLEDVSDVVETVRPHLLPSALEAVTLLNGRTGKKSIYAMPVAQQVEHIHVWKDMLDQAGLKLSDVPRTWNEYWDWWCKVAQPAVRRTTGNRNVFGIGQPMSSSASDTFFAFMMFLNAFDTKIVDPATGRLTVDDPKVRQGMIKALESYTKPFKDRCVPPGAVNWSDADNNVNFLNRITIMVPNPSLSIPASQYNNPDRSVYYEKMVTLEWPDKPDGRPIEYTTSIKTVVIFKNSKNKALAKEFMKFFLQPENLGPYLEGSLARWFPVDKRLIDRPYWKDQTDPHRVVQVRQYTQRPQVPFPHVYNHRIIAVNAENAWGKAVTRVVLDNWTAERAIDELIARMKELVG
ncbi:MAG: extracellular solute-binding protein [Geminicoccaceae bacterium]|nr:extracellular solute-binding protein [Geminicoccaceae bacterium]MDW8341525.1 extracellular solute-binding protein [Geminicoccaceae bacterium]